MTDEDGLSSAAEKKGSQLLLQKNDDDDNFVGTEDHKIVGTPGMSCLVGEVFYFLTKRIYLPKEKCALAVNLLLPDSLNLGFMSFIISIRY